METDFQTGMRFDFRSRHDFRNVAANINPQEMTEQELAKLMIGSDIPED